MIPDYFNYLLTGVKKAGVRQRHQHRPGQRRRDGIGTGMLERLGLPVRLFGPLSMPGETVGSLRPDIAETVGFQTTVVLPATHDTGSAFLAVPAEDDNAVLLPSGTWSLLGVENPEPITSEASRLQNFTNEGGAWYRLPLPEKHHGSVDDPVHPPGAERRGLCGGQDPGQVDARRHPGSARLTSPT